MKQERNAIVQVICLILEVRGSLLGMKNFFISGFAV